MWRLFALLFFAAAVTIGSHALPLQYEPLGDVYAGGVRSGPVKVFVSCGWHGREFATVKLCEAWQRRVEELRSHATEAHPSWVEWRFMSNVNEEGTRMAQQEGNACHRGNAAGVDLNRNFPPIAVCPDGDVPRRPRFLTHASRDAEEYPGPFPESEPETREYERQVRAFEPDIALLVHTGVEGILLPYDACFQPAPGDLFLRQKAVGIRLAKSVGMAPGRVGTLTNTIGYAAVGTAADWTFAVNDVPLTFTLETYVTPSKCDPGAHVRKMKTVNMTDAECMLTFVPHNPHTCRVDIEGYIQRWLPLVDEIERLTYTDKDRKTLEGWLDKFILQVNQQ